MAPVPVKDAKVWRQTKALLYKNYLVKLRTKKTSIQEILLPLFVLMLLMFLSMMHPNKHYDAMPSSILGSLHEYMNSDLNLGYTPVNNVTSRLMQLAYKDCLPRAVFIEQFSDEEALKVASIAKQKEFVGIIFKNAMSYQLRFFPDLVPVTKFYTDSRANCHIQECESASYLHSEFTSLQACIDSSIIKLKTNYSIWNELKSTKVILMGEPAMMEIDTVPRTIILFYLVMAFSPFGYYVATHVVSEKEKKLKEFMKIMGLHDTAFWLSWVLLYSSFIFIMSLLMAIIVTVFSPFPNSNYFLIFALFFLYGISLIFFALMLTPFFKKAKHVGAVEFFATLVFGCIGLLIVLVEDFPKPYVWLLSPFCHCTFLIGIAQVMHLEDQETGALFSNLKEGPCPLIITFVFLVVDSTIYLLLAIYLDQVLPGEYGLRRSPFFFLTPSYWSKKTRDYSELDEGSVNRNLNISEMAEPVSEEFHGKAAIRIAGVQKTFRKKDENVEALRGLSFDIYEGQITALLGHSGTGKTTLMNILCGLCPVSEGVATIYGHKVSEFDEMLEVRKMTGICPQMDILFDVLTVEENLSVFAKIKGIDNKRTEQEVHSVMQDLDMNSIKDNQAVKLSGGQKRKLSLGVAILGNPKVLLLDEPTAGMDPCSRHVVWNVLKKRKADRVTVFSTHFMDEADIIADRKAVISQGMLKCIGSSLFLKSKWGVGYRLSLDINKDFDVETLTSLIKGHIAGADLLQQHEHEIVYALPFKEMDKFSDLFSDLDSHNDLGVLTYGVSMTTLEDVFLKLEVEAEIDQADYSVFNQKQQQQTEDDLDRKSLDEMEQSLLMLSESKPFATGSPALWRQQIASVARFHFLNLKRENKSLRVVLLLLLIFLALQLVMFLLHRYFRSVVGPVSFSPDMYFLKPGQESSKFRTSLLLQNSTGSSIEDVVDLLRSQNIAVDMMNGSDYVAISPHNAALNVLRFEKVYVFEAIFNSTMVHSLPVLVNIISNLALDSLNGTQPIQTASNPFFQEITETVFKLELYFQAAILGIIVTGMPPYFAMENADCHKMRVYSQLKMAGLYPSAYWVGQAVVDIPLFLLILIVMMGSLFAFHFGVYFYADKFIAVIFCLIGYVPAVILFTYVISFTYRRVHNTQEFWSFIFSVTSLLTVIIAEVTYFVGNDFITTIIHDLFSVFIPIYPLVGCLICFIKISWKGAQNTDSPWSRLFIAVISPYLQCVVLLCVLRYLELKNGGRSIRQDPFFRACRKKIKVWTSSEAPNDEDDDVRAERAMVSEMLTSDNCEEKPAILVNSLYKEYDEKKNPLLGRKIKKLATKNVTLSVRKGEILGLLGPNGAGKSTLINMLVGVTEPTAGQVLMGDHSVTGHEGNSPTSFVGYCPQTNPLWPEITLQEHLEVFGTIKGMSVHDLKEAIKRVASALDLKEHLQKPSKKMSAGIKRKLCFALSMLGNPHIVLLDEPSTGMDPKAKQQMWRAVRTAFKSKERAAILTTHYMEEADAVCDRVAIMVSGQLRCIGSVQHLKSKFGRKYFLDMKLRECEEGHKMELLQREIEHVFPHACRQESFASILSYKIPKEDVQSLSIAFCKLEEVKQAFNIEEYSLSQSTLEQVFVEFAKEQEVEDDNFGTMNSSLWWERSQEDRVIF